MGGTREEIRALLDRYKAMGCKRIVALRGDLPSGMASYGDFRYASDLVEFIRRRQSLGQRGLMVTVAEGASAEGEDVTVAFRVPGSPQADRYGGIAERLARWIEKETGWESRHVVLGHLQRSSHPTTTDRFLTLTMGVEVARMVDEGAWGHAVVYRDGRVTRAPITDLMGPARLVPKDHRWVQFAQRLDLFI